MATTSEQMRPKRNMKAPRARLTAGDVGDHGHHGVLARGFLEARAATRCTGRSRPRMNSVFSFSLCQRQNQRGRRREREGTDNEPRVSRTKRHKFSLSAASGLTPVQRALLQGPASTLQTTPDISLQLKRLHFDAFE